MTSHAYRTRKRGVEQGRKTMTEEAQVRSRTRPIQATVAAPAPGRGPAPAAAPDDSFMHRGADANQHRARELERQAQRREQGYAPFRYWLPVGAQGDIIILDNELGPCFYEHAIPGPGNDWSKVVHELCPKEYDTCPLCAGQQGQKESYYIMFLSIIDLRPYTKRDGTVVQWSRKLLAVKAQQQNYFVRLLERCNNNLRGTHLLMTRDAQQSFNIGNPEMVASYTEEQIAQSFSHPEVRSSQDNRVLKAANADMFPYEYGKIFRRPSGEDLRKRYGGVAPAGAAAEVADAWGGEDPAPAAPASEVAPVAPAAAPAPAGGIQRHASPDTPAAPATPAASAAPAVAPAGAPAGGGGPASADLDDEIPF